MNNIIAKRKKKEKKNPKKRKEVCNLFWCETERHGKNVGKDKNKKQNI